MRLVRVVMRILSFLFMRWRTWLRMSSIWPWVGLTMILGSTSPVGRMICSTGVSERCCSYLPGVADR